MTEQNKGTEERERDRLWERVFVATYDTLYNSIEMGTYIRRLEFLNTFAFATTCLTGGSGVAALIAKQTVWRSPGGDWIWVALLIVAGLAGGVRSAVEPAKKIPDLQRLVGDLNHLRSDLEELRSVMSANSEFSVASVQKKYSELNKRCKELAHKCPVSFLLHLAVRQECQKETTERLKDWL